MDRLTLSPHATAVDCVTRPDLVVPAPRYLLSHWLPYLGHARLLLAVAFRQAAFVSRCSLPERAATLSLADLARWCGLKASWISEALQTPGYLAWFARRQDPPSAALDALGRPRKKAPANYAVRVSVPLAPHHAAALLELLARFDEVWSRYHTPGGRGQTEAFLRAFLDSFDERAFRELSRGWVRPAESAELPPMAMEAYLEQRFGGPLSPAAQDLVAQLHAAVVHPQSALVFTHYFLRVWLPELTSLEALTIQALRVLTYAREGIGLITLPGGIGELAGLVHADRRTMRALLQRAPQRALGRFLAVEGDLLENEGPLTLRVALADPVHPRHAGAVQALAARLAAGEDPAAIDFRFWEPAEAAPADHKIRIELLQNPDTVDEIPGYPPCDRTPEQQQFPESPVAESGNPGSRIRIDGTQNPDWSIDSENPDDQAIDSNANQPPQAAGVGEGWDVRRLLSWGGVRVEKAQPALQRLARDPRARDNWIAWWLWALERSRRGGPGIASPELYALSRMGQDAPPLYGSLARLGPERLLAALEGQATPRGLDAPAAQASLSALRQAGLPDLLRALLGEPAGPGQPHAEPGDPPQPPAPTTAESRTAPPGECPALAIPPPAVPQPAAAPALPGLDQPAGHAAGALRPAGDDPIAHPAPPGRCEPPALGTAPDAAPAPPPAPGGGRLRAEPAAADAGVSSSLRLAAEPAAPAGRPPALESQAELARAWAETLAVLRLPPAAPPMVLREYLEPCRPLGLRGAVADVLAPSPYARDYLQSRWAATLARHLSGVLARLVTVEFVADAAPAAPSQQPTGAEEGRKGVSC